MNGIRIQVWYERLNYPNNYAQHNRLPYVAYIDGNNVSHEIPTNEEVWARELGVS